MLTVHSTPLSTDTLVAKEVIDEPPLDEPMDEACRLEARRKRREAIKAKYRAQATPLLIQALQRGAETDSSTPTPGADTSNAKVASGEFGLFLFFVYRLLLANPMTFQFLRFDLL